MSPQDQPEGQRRGHGHGHFPGPGPGTAAVRGRHRRALAWAFGSTFAFMVVELVAGLLTGSLALLSDAAHMGTDSLGLGMALAAVSLAGRAGTSQTTFGTYRLEVLAALANGVLLFGVAGYVLVEAARRIDAPPDVDGPAMLVVAAAGLTVNLVCLRLLRSGSRESLNVRGAYLEVGADLLGSIGVIVAALVVWTTGWAYADPIVGAAIGLFILPRTFVLAKHALRILMEVAPPGVDVDEVRARILALPGVVDVHDLHIWTLTSGMDSASGHVVIAAPDELHPVLDRVTDLLATEFGVTHATIQCEPAGHRERGCPMEIGPRKIRKG